MQEIVSNKRQHGVELEAAALAAKGDGRIVAHYPSRHLHDDLGNHGIDLAGHDGGIRLQGRQVDGALLVFKITLMAILGK